MTQLTTTRIPSIALILTTAFACGLGLFFAQHYFSTPKQPPLQAALLYPQPREIPDFTLAQANGKPLTKADWRGHWTLIFFGYTSCPDVCPTTLAVFKQAWGELVKLGQNQRIQINFISVDPQRDTLEQLGKYVAFFSPDFIAATGSDEELTRVTRGTGQMFTRGVDAKGNVEVDHSASVVIVNPQAQVAGMFRPPLSAPIIVADLQTLLKSE
jgi:protein SCO1/2